MPKVNKYQIKNFHKNLYMNICISNKNHQILDCYHHILLNLEQFHHHKLDGNFPEIHLKSNLLDKQTFIIYLLLRAINPLIKEPVSLCLYQGFFHDNEENSDQMQLSLLKFNEIIAKMKENYALSLLPKGFTVQPKKNLKEVLRRKIPQQELLSYEVCFRPVIKSYQENICKEPSLNAYLDLKKRITHLKFKHIQKCGNQMDQIWKIRRNE
ncbi:unnamed protein product [Paramecium sonneborni]|uniref:Uncharacterized protein n=1 Tax=Paramecium sonneborni TaxID=65129 RepID=A0A8S1RUP7_9CILI|nr:unnamed protein product [Paramecium sonneborni]